MEALEGERASALPLAPKWIIGCIITAASGPEIGNRSDNQAWSSYRRQCILFRRLDGAPSRHKALVVFDVMKVEYYSNTMGEKR